MSRLKDIKPIIEGRLYEWGNLARAVPSAPISSAYEEPPRTTQKTSQQEAWVIRWEERAQLVERLLKNMSNDQRALVMMRYRERLAWSKIAEALHVSPRKVFYIRDQVLTIFGYEFGLLRSEENGLAG